MARVDARKLSDVLCESFKEGIKFEIDQKGLRNKPSKREPR